jgi:hypothetical protein
MHRIIPSLGCAVALALAACGGDAAETADTGAMTPPATATSDTMAMGGTGTTGTGTTGSGMAGGMAGAVPTEQELTATVDSIATAAQGGLTNVPPAAALPMIERVERALSGSSDAALRDVATDLGRLRTALGGTNASGGEIGGILQDLGRKVTAYAPSAPSALRDRLRQLGTTLTQQGGQLAGR